MNGWKSLTASIFRRLPERVRNSLFHLGFLVAPNEFHDFAHRYAGAPSMAHGLQAMARLGFEPNSVIDVGAFKGDWSRLARCVWPRARVVMVEPNSENHAALASVLQEPNVSLIPALLGSEDGRQVVFHVMSSGSSVMEERSSVSRAQETRTLTRLDSVLPRVDGPALLKIDAQGYELEILKGATKIMPTVEAILLEVAIIEINVGAPLLHAVTAFMADQGFVAYDILEIHRRPLDRALNQVDIVFVRPSSPLLADKRHYA